MLPCLPWPSCSVVRDCRKGLKIGKYLQNKTLINNYRVKQPGYQFMQWMIYHVLVASNTPTLPNQAHLLDFHENKLLKYCRGVSRNFSNGAKCPHPKKIWGHLKKIGALNLSRYLWSIWGYFKWGHYK